MESRVALSNSPVVWLCILQVCRAIDALPEGTDILSRIFAGASVYYNFTGQVACFQPDDSGNVDLGTRGWDWQVALIPPYHVY